MCSIRFKLLLSIFMFSLSILCLSQNNVSYISLDQTAPISFDGKSISFKGTKTKLGTKIFFIDGQLSNEFVAQFPFVFNSVNDAIPHLTDGDENKPMTLLIAPYVYWIDNPDDPEIRKPKRDEHTPFGLEIKCEWLRFHGLTNNPEKVILASNRGQTMGAKGNFTMLNIVGNGTSSENITFANYCNIDLEYQLKPELNRKKRGSAIVQAQLVFTNGDKIVARNTHFISRLNLCPFYGGKRTLFENCHFEMTDDALAPKGLYLNCTFEFYSSKPFGHTSGTGAVFLNCDIKSFTRGEQYFVKNDGQVAAIDTRLCGQNTIYWGWRDEPTLETRYYHYNNHFNKQAVSIGEKHPYATVDMNGKSILDAYRLIHNGEVIYNTYNLLRGNDDWDPMGVKKRILTAEKDHGKSYTNIPTQLLISPTRKTLETGKDEILLQARALKFGDILAETGQITWKIDPKQNDLVQLTPNNNGSCVLTPTNTYDETMQVTVMAETPLGLEAACVFNIAPAFMHAPDFIREPTISLSDGTLTVCYELDMSFDDQSLITWYRCNDASGASPTEVAVSRFNKPMHNYKLSHGDIGYYILASVEPKHLRCESGNPRKILFSRPINENDIHSTINSMPVNLKNLSTKYQPLTKPGFWSIDSYAPNDTKEHNLIADNSKDAWYYGKGINGASNDTGLIQATKGARLRYTPVGNKFDNMKLTFTACPAKTAGQGFSSARAQYMDVGINFDIQNMNGYALRLIRTTKYSDAIDCYFVKYTNGNAEKVSREVSTSCYRTPCFITVESEKDKIKAQAYTTSKYHISPNHEDVLLEVDIETNIEPTGFGGITIQHTGSVSSGATLIKDLKIEWNNHNN